MAVNIMKLGVPQYLRDLRNTENVPGFLQQYGDLQYNPAVIEGYNQLLGLLQRRGQAALQPEIDRARTARATEIPAGVSPETAQAVTGATKRTQANIQSREAQAARQRQLQALQQVVNMVVQPATAANAGGVQALQNQASNQQAQMAMQNQFFQGIAGILNSASALAGRVDE